MEKGHALSVRGSCCVSGGELIVSSLAAERDDEAAGADEVAPRFVKRLKGLYEPLDKPASVAST